MARAILVLLLLTPCVASAQEAPLCKTTILVRDPCVGYRVPVEVVDSSILLGEAAKKVGCKGPGAPQCIIALKAAIGHAEAELVKRTKERDAQRKRGEVLDARIAELSTKPEIPWYERPGFVAPMTAIAVGLAAVAVWQIAEAL